ncbi:hypothetical protein ACQ4LE_003507 [Meloidogyne hapla]|uniref:Uncharacterized protein n=1 Tax=Meloidogyne hapla TaxID=6305 RepID=A0A1I8B1R0_MELHA
MSTAFIALAVVIQLLGQVKTEEANKIVGLAKHNLKEGMVTLAEGSKIATKEDMEQYKARFPEACDVAVDDFGNIKLLYSKNGSAKNGCTVDILTNIENAIEFATGMNLSSNCLTEDSNNNTLPFAYSLSSAEIKKLQKGPLLNDSDSRCYKGCEKSKCIKTTGLEVRWKATGEDEEINLSINPIGSLSYHSASGNMSEIQSQKEYPIVKIDQNTDRYSIRFPGEENGEENDCIFNNFSCIINTTESVLSPITWKINGTSPDDEMKFLLVFHLLPQNASRMQDWNDSTNPKVLDNPPDGPKCEELSIIFSKENYTMLTLEPPTTAETTTDSINTTAIIPKESPTITTEEQTNITSMTTSEPITTSTNTTKEPMNITPTNTENPTTASNKPTTANSTSTKPTTSTTPSTEKPTTTTSTTTITTEETSTTQINTTNPTGNTTQISITNKTEETSTNSTNTNDTSITLPLTNETSTISNQTTNFTTEEPKENTTLSTTEETEEPTESEETDETEETEETERRLAPTMGTTSATPWLPKFFTIKTRSSSTTKSTFAASKIFTTKFFIIVGAVVGVLFLLAVIIAIIYVTMDYYDDEEEEVEIETIYKVKPKEPKIDKKEGESSIVEEKEVEEGKGTEEENDENESESLKDTQREVI